MSDLPTHTSAEEVHAHPVATGRKRLDLLLAIAAISISLMSLFVAFSNERTQRELVASNSWPFPIAGSSTERLGHGGEGLTLSLVNAGIGPARVKWVAMSLDGRPVRTPAEFASACCGVPAVDAVAFVHDGMTGSAVIDGVVPARAQNTFMIWRRTALNAPRWGRLKQAGRRLSYRACYCSALDECWRSELSSVGEPSPVRACPPPDGNYTG